MKKSVYLLALVFSYISSFAQTITFSYDNNGNMIQKNSTGYFDKKAVLSAKVILGGAYSASTSLMSDQLRVQNILPANEPYTGISGFVHIGGGGETVTPSVLAVSGNNAIVDWIFIELRDAKDSKTIIATRSALLQRDGDIVDTDGTSPVSFNACASQYYIVIRHRNHLGIMTQNPVYINELDKQPLDLTLSSTLTYGTNARRSINAITSVMWAGDINRDKQIKYNGSSNDKNTILSLVGLLTPNNIISGYNRSDLNLDGQVKYNGSSNDKNVILQSVGLLTPNNIIVEQIAN